MKNYKVAVSIKAKNFSEALRDSMKAKEKEAELLELRIDYLDQIHSNDISLLVGGVPDILKIITNRHREESGNNGRAGWRGNEHERIFYLEKAIQAGAEYIDIEFRHFHSMNRNRKKTKLIVSHHNFNETPDYDSLRGIYELMAFHPEADIVKIATRARSQHDADKMIRLAEEFGKEKPLIALAMGRHGRETYLQAPKLGAPFTYASLTKRKCTSPGQMTIDELRSAWK